MRRGIAALDPQTGRLAPWNARLDGAVSALASRGQTLFVAGDFTTAGAERRRTLAALDARSAIATPWRPDVDGDVRELVVDDDKVYVVGDFRRIGSQVRPGIAALDAEAGTVRPWTPQGVATSNRLAALAADEGVVVAVGGDGLAAWNAGDGRRLDWQVSPVGPGGFGATAIAGGVVYVGGFFDFHLVAFPLPR